MQRHINTQHHELNTEQRSRKCHKRCSQPSLLFLLICAEGFQWAGFLGLCLTFDAGYWAQTLCLFERFWVIISHFSTSKHNLKSIYDQLWELSSTWNLNFPFMFLLLLQTNISSKVISYSKKKNCNTLHVSSTLYTITSIRHDKIKSVF